jgi:hypothetical protein
MNQKVQKNVFFCDVTKVENFDKKCLTLSKKNQKSPFKHFRFGRSPVKGLTSLDFSQVKACFKVIFNILSKVLERPEFVE